MKTTGATWNAYLKSWPESQWFDDSNETVNGIPGDDFVGPIPDDAVIEISCGLVFPDQGWKDGKDLVRHFRAWERAQTTNTLLIEIPKGENETLLRAAVITWGGRVRT